MRLKEREVVRSDDFQIVSFEGFSSELRSSDRLADRVSTGCLHPSWARMRVPATQGTRPVESVTRRQYSWNTEEWLSVNGDWLIAVAESLNKKLHAVE